MPNPVIIQVKRGLKADLPILADGEIGFCTDTLEIFIGNNGVNVPTGSTYVHPESHPASMITESVDRVFLSAAEKTEILNRKDDYVHTQTSSSATWDIPHMLNKYPNFTIIDSSGTTIDGGVPTYISKNLMRIVFSAEFSGKAYLS